MDLSKSTTVQPSHSEPQMSSETSANLKQKAYSFISDSLQEFHNSIRIINQIRIESLLSPFETLKGKLFSFLTGATPESRCPEVVQTTSSTVCRVLGLLAHITSKAKPLREERDRKKPRVCREIVSKIDAPLRALNESFRAAPSEWPSTDRWRALQDALDELCGCLFHLQYDPLPGTSSPRSTFTLLILIRSISNWEIHSRDTLTHWVPSLLQVAFQLSRGLLL